MSLFADKAPGAKPPRNDGGKAKQRLEQLRTRLGHPPCPPGIPDEVRFTVMDRAEHWKRCSAPAGEATEYQLERSERV